jgi:hypothetical protein
MVDDFSHSLLLLDCIRAVGHPLYIQVKVAGPGEDFIVV